MMIEYICRSCGADKMVDVDSRDGFSRQAGVYAGGFYQDGSVTISRCYCSNCGLMYHPATIDPTYGQ